MKTLFSRILLAQVVAVVLALTVVTLITRASLNQGFQQFLDRQERTVLESLAPALEEFFEQQGSWDLLEQNPDYWQRVWRISRAGAGGPRAGQQRGRPRDVSSPETGPPAGPPPDLRWMANPGRGALRDRLFLLDARRMHLAGAEASDVDADSLQAVSVDGTAVGWIGFAPMGSALPPDAERFLQRQLQITALALALALVVAAVLAWILARTVSRPVQGIGNTVRRLSEGAYDARAALVSADEIGILAVHVNRLAETLELNRTARQRWMADIAHELRTPVAVMKGEVEAIADGVRAVDDRTVASLTEEIDHLAGMVDDLQALALSDAGALALEKEVVDLAELARLAADSFRNRLAARGIALETDHAGLCRVSGDPQRLRQLLHNLLENSSRYTETNGTVRLVIRGGDPVTVSLEDSGPGVSDEQLDRLFDRFYRAESSRSRATGGSGLGLAICRNIAEAHGGRIEAVHGSMGGLQIKVELPT